MLLTKRKKNLSSEPGSDEEAIAMAKKDPEAFEVLYKKYFEEIFRFLHKKVQDRQETADLVSKVFIKSFQGIEEFTYQGIPYSAWLYRVAINEANQYFRGNRIRHVVIDEQMGETVATEIQLEEEKYQLMDQLPGLINQLKPAEVELIELRFYEGMSFKQMGQILDMTENNCRVKTHRVVKKLEKLFSHE